MSYNANNDSLNAKKLRSVECNFMQFGIEEVECHHVLKEFIDVSLCGSLVIMHINFFTYFD